MKQRVLMIIVGLLMLLPLSVSAQSATPYQRRVAQITLKYYKIFAQGSGDRRFALFGYNDAEVAKDGLGLAVTEYSYKHGTAAGKRLLRQMAAEMKAAEKLKNATDRLNDFYKTDEGKIFLEVKNNFSSWNTKGEFETNADYMSRLQKQSVTMFNAACNAAIEKIGKSLLSKATIEVTNYDAENETYVVYCDANDFLTFGSIIDVPLNKAEDFKAKSKYTLSLDNIHPLRWVLIGNSLALKDFSIDNFETHDNNFNVYSTSIVGVKNGTEYDYNDSELKDVTIPFDDLGISNDYLKGYVYKDSATNLISRADDDNNVYKDVYQMPSFRGGDADFEKYCDEYAIIPENDKSGDLSQNVKATAIIEKDGSIHDVKINYSQEPELVSETVRLLTTMPKWNPGRKHNGQVVRVRKTFDIYFHEKQIY